MRGASWGAARRGGDGARVLAAQTISLRVGKPSTWCLPQNLRVSTVEEHSTSMNMMRPTVFDAAYSKADFMCLQREHQDSWNLTRTGNSSASSSSLKGNTSSSVVASSFTPMYSAISFAVILRIYRSADTAHRIRARAGQSSKRGPQAAGDFALATVWVYRHLPALALS